MGLIACKESRVISYRRSTRVEATSSNAKVVKVLLLGTSRAGKTTLYKQFKVIYDGGFSDEESRGYCDGVACSIFSLAGDTLIANDTGTMVDGEGGIEETPVASKVSLVEEEDSGKLSSKDQRKIIDMKTACFRNARTHNQDLLIRIFNEFSGTHGQQLLSVYDKVNAQESSCLQYFIARIPDIIKPDYVPTSNDLLHMRIPTTGLAEIGFQFECTHFQVYDVGGERTERRKWIHYFEGINAVLFVVDISGYDIVTDEGRNSLQESLEVFEEINQDRFLKGATMVLLFNKYDLFRKKISVPSLKQCFPDYKGGKDDCEATNFISDKFKTIFRSFNTSEIHMYFICATDSHMMKTVLQSVFSHIKST